MEISSMLSNGSSEVPGQPDARRLQHQYPTRNTSSFAHDGAYTRPYAPPQGSSIRNNGVSVASNGFTRASPVKRNQKHVVFQLIDPDDPRIQARLPMRVMISTNDTTDSIITTVKNFYGLYDYGVSFENREGISIIATYDNFEHDMTVYVRTVALPPNEHTRDSVSPHKPSLGAPFEMRPTLHNSQSPVRSIARSAGLRSLSPQSDVGRRSGSAAPGVKRIAKSKSKNNSVYGDADGYSSGDNGGGSVASSRRSKTELVNPEISVDNIVEGGRRKGAFESSQLPLFVPPQVPMTASISSISPQRRAGPPPAISPYAYSNQQTFSYTQPLPSPQSYSSSMMQYQQPAMVSNGFANGFQQPSRQLRGRPGPVAYPPPTRQPTGGIMPTPDPTVGSAISDEDVAIQLMRLGDPLAFSHGRTSTSTLDDAMSGKAELASSDEDDDDEEDEVSRLPTVPRFPNGDVGPQRKKQRLMNELPSDMTSGEEYEDRRDGTFTGDDADNEGQRKLGKHKSSKVRNSMPGSMKAGKPRPHGMAKPKAKSLGHFKTPMSPTSMPAPSRKPSIASSINFQHQFGGDEDDLSSKPRCQRCRKSKKGCDRQRPCGRCKDAGIGEDGCVSEDEGNGRKGRYGRHMGVSVAKADETFGPETGMPQASVPANGYFLAPALPDKNKKRKR